MRKELTLSFALLISSTLVFAATTNISQVPIATQIAVPPNIIFVQDDSGSMDWEILFHTNNGMLWWDKSTSSFTDAAGNPWFNNDGDQCQGNGSHYWYGFAYLFPNGTNQDARHYRDDQSCAYYAVPPIPAFAYARSSDYNQIYYNSKINYTSWFPAYANSTAYTFANASSSAARSHPIYPTSGTPTTINLAGTQSSTTDNWTFKMVPGMTIPGASISGITASKNGGKWQNINSNVSISGNDTYDVNVPYYPATFWNIDATCTGGAPNCATAPDGKKLRRYEIKAGNTFPSGRSYADELQNFANWFTYYRKRVLMVGGALGPILSQMSGVRGGVLSFNNLNPITMYDFNNTTPSQNWQNVLGKIYLNQADDGTPTREALNYAGQQFMNNSSIIQNACQINAAIVMTDGFAYASNVSPPSYNSNTYGGTAPYTTLYSPSLANIALAYYTRNLRPDLPAGQVPINTTDTSPNADRNTNLHMLTYGLTLGMDGTIFNTDTPQAANPFVNSPVWPDPNVYYTLAQIDDLWHATINGRGQMFTAGDPNLISTFMQNILNDVLSKSGSNSGITVTNVNLTSTNNTAYSSSYSGVYGDLFPVSINTTTGQATETHAWSARTQLDNQTWTNRYIATYNGAVGVPFRWLNLSLSQQLALNSPTIPPGPLDGALVLNWLRGDKSQEGLLYRPRVHILGDIVDAAPVLVQGAMANYSDTGYSTFSSTIANRTPVVYQGANDGLLHAFNANTGNEMWAYVPNGVFNNLQKLSSKTYRHLFYVDETPTVADVPINNGSTWRTLLVGGLGAGGNSYYALDVTNPNASSDSDVAGKVLWEFPNSSTSSSIKNEVGASYSHPIIAKTKAYGWVVLVSSGYNNNGGGTGHLYVLDPNTGSVIKDISTGVGSNSSPSGLGKLSAYADNPTTDATIDYVYGGDLLGNVWRFDLSGNTTSSWNVSLLATLVDSSGNPQPVTSAPELSHVGTRRMVYVGTGQLLGAPDLTSTQQQTMYGLVDNATSNPTISNVRTSLQQKTVTGQTISNSTVDYANYKGWYFNFPVTGERLSTDPLFALGNIIFTTNVPNATACTSKSYEYVIDPNTGGQVAGVTYNGSPAAIIPLTTTLTSKPTVVVLSNGQVVSITHNADNSFTTTSLPPVSVSTGVKTVAWKEVQP